MYAYDIALLAVKGNFDVGVFPAFFGQDLYAEIDLFMRRPPAVVTVNLAEQNDRRSPGSFGGAGHLQFIGRDGLEADRPGGKGTRREYDPQENG